MIQSIKDQTPAPPHVRSLRIPRPICPLTKRSAPNSPRKKQKSQQKRKSPRRRIPKQKNRPLRLSLPPRPRSAAESPMPRRRLKPKRLQKKSRQHLRPRLTSRQNLPESRLQSRRRPPYSPRPRKGSSARKKAQPTRTAVSRSLSPSPKTRISLRTRSPRCRIMRVPWRLPEFLR